jgi:dsRNA-specific ribonuclease
MARDTEKHKKIRENILRGISDKCKPVSSHQGDYDIVLYRYSDDKAVELAFPDIVIEGSDETLVVEIELDNTPKTILGDSAVIEEATHWKWNDIEHQLGPRSLLIVLDREDISKENSEKPGQLIELGRIMRRKCRFVSVRTIGDVRALELIINWLENRSLFFFNNLANDRIRMIEEKLDCRFKDKTLLIQALIRGDNLNNKTINSMGEDAKRIFKKIEDIENIGTMEGLATIGDSALNLAITNHFYGSGKNTPQLLSRPKADLAKNKLLNKFARSKLELDAYVIWSNNEPGKENSVRELATAFEALIGAVYLDQGTSKVDSVLSHIGFFDWSMDAESMKT